MAAHTSAGKTVVAEYAFAMALRYAPIKDLRSWCVSNRCPSFSFHSLVQLLPWYSGMPGQLAFYTGVALHAFLIGPGTTYWLFSKVPAFCYHSVLYDDVAAATQCELVTSIGHHSSLVLYRDNQRVIYTSPLKALSNQVSVTSMSIM